jgi:hypothetical protein
MPEPVRAILEFLISVGLTAGVAAGFVSWFIHLWLAEKMKARIKSEYDEKLEALKAQLKGQYDEKLETHKAQLKAQGDIEIEKLKSELSIAAARRQALFSNLQERRAEVITEVYASLKEALSGLAEYTKPFEPAGGASRNERRTTAWQAANAFAKLYDTKKIFIPEEAAKKLDEINAELKQAFLQFAYGVDLMPDGGSDRTTKWVEITQKVESLSKSVIGELERDFRMLLGE